MIITTRSLQTIQLMNMKTKGTIKILATCLAISAFSCVKKPSACFSADATNEILKVGQTVKFNAGCSNLATEYAWTIDSASTANVVKKLYTNEGKECVYTFNKKGTMR